MLRLKVRLFAWVIGLAGSAVWGQTFESLYSFPGNGSDGIKPYATLTLGSDGNMYGTTTGGGTDDDGTVFRVSTAGDVTILNDFEETTTGRFASGRMLNIGDGYLYGVTEQNGTVAGGPAGTVFRLEPGTGQLQQIFQVPGTGNTTPKKPHGLTMGEPNTLHVVCYDRAGIWRVPLDGVTSPSIAYTFTGADETASANTITRGADGFLYGTMKDAGTQSFGTIFRIAPDGTGMTRLYNGNRTTGGRPYSTLVQAPDGNLYGTMEDGGPDNGCIYRLTPDGEFQVIYYFGTGVRNDLRYPHGDLMIATDGLLYGTTFGGGVNGCGGIFRIKTNGTGYKVLHAFNSTNGREPEGGLVQAGDGNLYGTTVRGGDYDSGTVFRIKLNLPPPPVNRLPVAVDDLAVSTGDPVSVDVLVNDFDPDDDALTVEIKDAPTAGSATIQPGGSILYTPNDQYVDSDQFSYKISDGRGGTATAVVRITSTTPGPLVKQGLYNGILALDPELKLQGGIPRAQFVVSVQASGSFTGVLNTQRKRVPFRGSFDLDSGTAITALKMPGKGVALLFLSFRAGDPNTIVGALFGSEVWSGVAGPVHDSGSSTKESYTVLVGGDSSLADGYGYGVMKMLPNGLVVAVGRLGDGTRFSWGSALISLPTRPTVLPVFCEPLKGGVCSGVLDASRRPEVTASALPGQELSGSLIWVRPAAKKPNQPYALGFTGVVEVLASHFLPPGSASGVLDFESGKVMLGNGPLPGTVEGSFTIDGKKVQTSSPLRSLSFNRKTGLFSGMMQVGPKTLRFQGAVGQTIGKGFGQFSIHGVTGSVMLRPDLTVF